MSWTGLRASRTCSATGSGAVRCAVRNVFCPCEAGGVEGGWRVVGSEEQRGVLGLREMQRNWIGRSQAWW